MIDSDAPAGPDGQRSLVPGSARRGCRARRTGRIFPGWPGAGPRVSSPGRKCSGEPQFRLMTIGTADRRFG